MKKLHDLKSVLNANSVMSLRDCLQIKGGTSDGGDTDDKRRDRYGDE